MAGNVIAVESWARHPDRTYISLGSALDPLFGAEDAGRNSYRRPARAALPGML
jgi:hypothetical protein